MNTTFNCFVFFAFLLCECSFGGHGELSKNFLRDTPELDPINVNHQQLLQPIQRNCKKKVAVIGKNDHTSCVDLPYHKHGVPRRYLADKPKKGDLDHQLLIPSDVLLQPPPSTKQRSPSREPKNNNNRDVEGIIIIVGAISVVVIIVGLVLICCLTGGPKVGSENKQRDDKPLLPSTSNDLLADGTPVDPTDKKLGRKESLKSPLDVSSDGNQEGSGNANGTSLQDEKSSPPPPPAPSAPPPPPPKKPAPPPPPKARPPPAPPGAKNRGKTSSTDGGDPTGDSDAKKTKMKPFFWDKMAGNGNQSMVWDEIRGGSFVFNEEMMEALFGYNPDDKKPGDRRGRASGAPQPQYIQIIDHKKAQNLSILLKALNVTTEEVRDALVEGNELPAELLQNLLRMAPTQEEELKLRLYNGPLEQLGPADRFLKVIVEIPFAYKRMESLVFMITFKEEVTNVKESFSTLEVACDELTKSRLFLKLLEAVLKTGNRMNNGTYRGGAQAFKLDTLLKLADVKGLDGKTTLLHFVVQEIVRTEGMKAIRATRENRRISSIKSDDFVAEDPSFVVETENYQTIGLQVVSSISNELQYVKKAAIIDGDVLTTTVSKLNQSLVKIKDFISNDMPRDTEELDEFFESLTSFVTHSEGEVSWLQEEERRISELVKKTTDSFHGSSGRDEGLRLFVIVRDFLRLLDRICEELKKSFAQQARSTSKERSFRSTVQDQRQSLQEMRQRLFPTISPKQANESSSDDDDDDSNDISKKAQTPSSKETSPKKATQKAQTPSSKETSLEKATQDHQNPIQDMRQRLAAAVAPKPVEDVSSSDSDSDDSKHPATSSKDMPPKTTIQDQQQSVQDMRQRLSPAIAAKRIDDSSSDSDSDDSKKTQAATKEMLPKTTTQDERRPIEDMRQRLPLITSAKLVDKSSSDSDSDDDSDSFSQKKPSPMQEGSSSATTAKHAADDSSSDFHSDSVSKQTLTVGKELPPQKTTEEQKQSMQRMRQRLPLATPAKRIDESSSDPDSNSSSYKLPTPSKGMSRRTTKQDQTPSKEIPSRQTTEDQQQPMQDIRQRLFPAIAANRVDDSSSDSE